MLVAMASSSAEKTNVEAEKEAQDFLTSCTAELAKLNARPSFLKLWGSASMRLADDKNGNTTKEPQMSDHALEKRVAELRSALGPLSGRAKLFCSDECLRRFLRARNGNVKKAEKMLSDTLEWREKYKPEDIRWKDVAKEGETGKVYRTNFHDKMGRTVLVMAPGRQNSTDHEGQIRHLVFCMENAILSLDPGCEKIVWLVDFRNWTIRTSPPLKTALETLNILQNHYPERLGAAICYDPPKIFEAFWKVIKPFVDPLTRQKVKFIYPDEPRGLEQIEEAFELDKLETSFGGRSSWEFDILKYSALMEEDDLKAEAFWRQAS